MNSLSEHEQMHIFTSFPETAQDDDTAQVIIIMIWMHLKN